jgi:predicted PurR-regulated permease PerM
VKPFAKRVAVAVLVVGAVAVAAYTVQILLLVFAGVLLAVVFRSAGCWLAQRTALSINGAMAVVLLVFTLLVLGTLWEFGSGLANEADQILLKASESLTSLQRRASHYEGLRHVLSAGNLNLQESAGSALSLTINAAAAIVLVLFVGVYASLNPRLYLDLALMLFPRQQRIRIDRLLAETARGLRWWVLGQLVSMAAVGIITAIGMLVAKVPMALSLSLIAALFTFVPYLGAIVSAIPAILIGLTVSSQTALYVILIFLVAHVVEGYIVSPMIQHRFVYLPPALILASQFLMEVLAGVVGIMMATPLLVVAMVLIHRLYLQQSWEGVEAA